MSYNGWYRERRHLCVKNAHVYDLQEIKLVYPYHPWSTEVKIIQIDILNSMPFYVSPPFDRDHVYL